MGERLAMRATSMSAAALLVAAAVLAAISMRFIVAPDKDWGGPTIVVDRPTPPPPDEPPPTRRVRPIVSPSAPMPTDDSASPVPTPLPVPEPPTSSYGPTEGVGPVITPADFIVRPNGADFGDFYPDRALARNKQGRVLVRCSVNAAGRLVSCGVLEEEPAGWGFGNASTRLAEQKFVVRPQTVNGQPTDGGTITFPIRWRLPG